MKSDTTQDSTEARIFFLRKEIKRMLLSSPRIPFKTEAGETDYRLQAPDREWVEMCKEEIKELT